MDLPTPIAKAVQPLFDLLPIDQAMEQLVVTRPAASKEVRDTLEEALKDPALKGKPDLAAGLWLYIDELDRSHTISQGIDDSTGSFWHGIMHRREGDFSNSHYWFRRTGEHPVMAQIPDYDPHVFIDEVEELHKQQPPGLIEKQRAEWRTLFSWCAHQGR